MKLIEYRVKGNYHFPLDMLRYDNSCPASTDDAQTISGNNDGDIPLSHPVEILLHGLRCTPDRWASFGWKVTAHRKI